MSDVMRTYFDTGSEKLFFDAVISIQHDTSTSLTEHPIQEGAAITDHAYEEPAKLIVDIGMSDVMQSIIPGQFEGGSSRSVNAYEKMRELQVKRLPVCIITRLASYSNMMIETISTTDTNKTAYGLRATITLKQIFVVNAKTVKISERAHKTDESNEGEQKAVKTDESLLKRLFK